MFVFEWLLDWFYSKLMGFVQDFFTRMGDMGADIFNLSWVQGILEFFRMFGWALYVVGLVVLIFDVAIAAQNGKGNLKDAAINALKGFFAVSLFTVLPVELYKFSITLQGQLGNDMAGLFGSESRSISQMAQTAMSSVMGISFINIFFIIALGYCVIKIFFANIKRGGIMLISIAVGSLYMFSVPRGYNDGFIRWCKQIIAICVTAFLQMTLLMAGLITFKDNMMLGTGIMLAANEVPRIADTFGLDTSARLNIMSTYYATQAAVNTAKAVMKAVRR